MVRTESINTRRKSVLLIYNEMCNYPVSSGLLRILVFAFKQTISEEANYNQEIAWNQSKRQEWGYFNGCCHQAVMDSLNPSPPLLAHSCRRPWSWSVSPSSAGRHCSLWSWLASLPLLSACPLLLDSHAHPHRCVSSLEY